MALSILTFSVGGTEVNRGQQKSTEVKKNAFPNLKGIDFQEWLFAHVLFLLKANEQLMNRFMILHNLSHATIAEFQDPNDEVNAANQ